MKKLFEEIISGAFEAATRRANSAENAPEGDAEEHFKAIVKTFEIASTDKIQRKIKVVNPSFFFFIDFLKKRREDASAKSAEERFLPDSQRRSNRQFEEDTLPRKLTKTLRFPDFCETQKEPSRLLAIASGRRKFLGE